MYRLIVSNIQYKLVNRRKVNKYLPFTFNNVNINIFVSNAYTAFLLLLFYKIFNIW